MGGGFLRPRPLPHSEVRDAGARSGDTGVTLIEVMVSTAVASVVLAVLGTGVVLMNHTAGAVVALNSAQSELHVAFQRLDREVRYASSISTPADSGGFWYVEYTFQRVPAVGQPVPMCAQLRLTPASPASQLQRRIWQAGQQPSPTWGALANNVVAIPDRTPFEYHRDPASGARQRLTIRLAATAGGIRDAETAQIQVSITALNSSSNSQEPTQCKVRMAS
jgi:hypothetical protein